MGPPQIAARLAGRPAPAAPTGQALADLVAEHYEETLAFYGAELGARVARKHLGWYMDATGTPPDLRRDVLTAAAPRVRALLPAALSTYAEAA